MCNSCPLIHRLGKVWRLISPFEAKNPCSSNSFVSSFVLAWELVSVLLLVAFNPIFHWIVNSGKHQLVVKWSNIAVWNDQRKAYFKAKQFSSFLPIKFLVTNPRMMRMNFLILTAKCLLAFKKCHWKVCDFFQQLYLITPFQSKLSMQNFTKTCGQTIFNVFLWSFSPIEARMYHSPGRTRTFLLVTRTNYTILHNFLCNLRFPTAQFQFFPLTLWECW